LGALLGSGFRKRLLDNHLFLLFDDRQRVAIMSRHD
jgi:hypothetical protein